MRVIWTEHATRDLEELTAYIGDDSPQNAILVRRRITEASRLLGSTPLIGRPNARGNNREWVVARTGFLLRYRVNKTAVSILSVLRGTRDRN